MERLTIKDEDGDLTLNCNECSNDGSLNCDIENCYLTAICRLASIEDILGPTYDLSRLKELVEADREGRVAMFPCKQNDVLWTFSTYQSKNVYSFCVTDISCLNGMMMLNTDKLSVINAENVGKTVFLTREAAEKALEGRDG